MKYVIQLNRQGKIHYYSGKSFGVHIWSKEIKDAIKFPSERAAEISQRMLGLGTIIQYQE